MLSVADFLLVIVPPQLNFSSHFLLFNFFLFYETQVLALLLFVCRDGNLFPFCLLTFYLCDVLPLVFTLQLMLCLSVLSRSMLYRLQSVCLQQQQFLHSILTVFCVACSSVMHSAALCVCVIIGEVCTSLSFRLVQGIQAGIAGRSLPCCLILCRQQSSIIHPLHNQHSGFSGGTDG